MPEEVSLIIPMYKCEESAERTASEIADFLDAAGFDWELVLVDDGSPDGTGDAIKNFAEANGRVKAVSYSPNRGKGYAVKTGMLAASKKKRIFTDADLAYGLEPIGKFLEALDGCDVAAGSRRPEKGEESTAAEYGWKRTAMSRVFTAFTRVILGLDLDDTQCGFKGFKAEAAEKLFGLLTIERFGFDLEILALAKHFGMKTVPVHVKLLRHGESTVSPVKDGAKMLRDMFAVRRRIKRAEKEGTL